MNLIQLISLVGAATILLAFTLQVQGRWKSTESRYLWANLIGSAILAVVAWIESQWGFLVLETAWAAVSGWGVIKVARA